MNVITDHDHDQEVKPVGTPSMKSSIGGILSISTLSYSNLLGIMFYIHGVVGDTYLYIYIICIHTCNM